MATIKKVRKYEDGGKKKKPTPTYKNLPMGVKAQYETLTGETRSNIKPTGKDSADYRGGFEIGLKNRGKKNIKPVPGESPVQRSGRWEGQNTPQKKKGGAVKKKMQGGGVAGKSPKAPMVDPKGAYTKVQMRTLGNMKNGGTLTPTKKSVGKTIGKLNKGKSGMKMSKISKKK